MCSSDLVEESEWPPSLRKMYVFSSRSGCWDEKYFRREGDAAGTVREMRPGYERFSAVYLRGALYVQCISNFLMRYVLTLFNVWLHFYFADFFLKYSLDNDLIAEYHYVTVHTL